MIRIGGPPRLPRQPRPANSAFLLNSAILHVSRVGCLASFRNRNANRPHTTAAVHDAFAVRKEGKTREKERSARRKGRRRGRGGGVAEGTGAKDRRGRESGKGVTKSKVLSQRGSRHFAVACSAREMTSAKMADLRGAAVLHRCRACVHAYVRTYVLYPTRTGALDRRNDIRRGYRAD